MYVTTPKARNVSWHALDMRRLLLLYYYYYPLLPVRHWKVYTEGTKPVGRPVEYILFSAYVLVCKDVATYVDDKFSSIA